jgi:hypothetical protein
VAEEPMPPDDNSDSTDIEKLAEFIADQFLAHKQEVADLLASVPQPQEPLQPVVNVSAPPSEVVVNVAASELPAPTYAPQINVTSAPAQVIASPEINLHAESLNVAFKAEDMVTALGKMADVIGAGYALMVAEFVKLAASNQALASALSQSAQASDAKLDGVMDAVNRHGQILEAMLRTMNAPRDLVLDSKGQPTGIVVKS